MIWLIIVICLIVILSIFALARDGDERPILRHYIIVNTWTGRVCFNGRRFRTAEAAAKKIRRSAGEFADIMQIHRVV